MSRTVLAMTDAMPWIAGRYRRTSAGVRQSISRRGWSGPYSGISPTRNGGGTFVAAGTGGRGWGSRVLQAEGHDFRSRRDSKRAKIGSESCRERGCKVVEDWVGAGILKKKR